MEIRNPSAAEVKKLTSRISEAFGYPPGEPGVTRDFPQLYQPSNFQRLWVAAEAQGIAAHSGFYPALMKVEGCPLPVAGIGGVFTEGGHEGKGLATSLIQRCCDEALKGGAALAFLWSDKHEFYKKQGFHLAGRQWTLTLRPEHAPLLRRLGEKTGIPAAALRIANEPVGPEFLTQSYALLGGQPLGIVREAEEHALYLRGGSCRVISAWAGKQLAGYFVMGKGNDLQGYVHEWAGAEGALDHLAAQLLESGGEAFQLLSPQFMLDEVPWIYSLEEHGIPFAAEYLALVKLLDFEKVRRLVADYMRRIGLDPAELELRREGPDLYLAGWRGSVQSLSEEGLLRLLFGPELPAQEELRAFLPMRLWYWGMDSV